MQYEQNELNFIHKLLQPSLRPRIEEYVKNKTISGPLIVEFDPTSTCNFECPECINKKLLNKGQIKPSRALELLTEFNNAGVKGVVFIGGGEPLTHTAISKLFMHTYNLGMSIGLTTNGYLIDRHLETIALTVNWTRVSIDAATQKTFNIFRPSRTKCAFNKVISNIGSLAKIKKGKLGYCFLLIERLESDEILVTNCHEIIQAAQIAKDIGCDYFELKPVVNENHHLIKFSKKAKTLIQSQLEELQKLNSKSFRIIYPKSLEHALNSLSSNQPKIYTNCPTSELRVLVTPSGIYPCPYKRGYKKALISNLDVKFDEFWLSDKRKFCSKQINPNTDCQFYCIRHELNLFLNVLSKSYAEGIDLLPYIITTEALMDDFFI